MTRTKPVKAWRGFVGIVEDKPHFYACADGYDGPGDAHEEHAVYRKQRDARKRFERVIPVLITPAPAPKRRKKP